MLSCVESTYTVWAISLSGILAILHILVYFNFHIIQRVIKAVVSCVKNRGKAIIGRCEITQKIFFYYIGKSAMVKWKLTLRVNH